MRALLQHGHAVAAAGSMWSPAAPIHVPLLTCSRLAGRWRRAVGAGTHPGIHLRLHASAAGTYMDARKQAAAHTAVLFLCSPQGVQVQLRLLQWGVLLEHGRKLLPVQGSGGWSAAAQQEARAPDTQSAGFSVQRLGTDARLSRSLGPIGQLSTSHSLGCFR
jgi:hypothetical protein